MFRTAAVAVLSFSLSCVSAFADDPDTEVSNETASSETFAAGASLKPVHVGAGIKRPAVLAGLYASLAGLQAYDAMSTARGLKQGAREANPLMQGAANNSAVFWSIKAATTALPMVLAEKMWKRNKVGAVVMMAVANSVAVTVAANNARVLAAGR